MAPVRAGPLYTSDQKPLVPAALQSPRTLSLPGDRASAFDWAKISRPRYREEQTGRIWFISGLNLRPSPQSGQMMETQKDRKVLAAVCPNQMGRRRRRAAVSVLTCLLKQDVCDLVLNVLFHLQHKVLEPRSSSPVSVRLGLPGVLKQGELRASP